jgi:hypothetical protein
MSNGIILNNGKAKCPRWDGPCDMGKPCVPKCRRKHKEMTNRKRRLWNKKKIKEECLEAGDESC